MYNKALKNALYQSDNGKTLIIQSKKAIHSKKVGERIKLLKNLVFRTFVTDVPKGSPKRFDVYDTAKPAIRKLGKNGGENYNNMITALKYVWVSNNNFSDTIKLLSKV